MRQQNNGRRRQNRGSNRRSYGATNGNLNKNTVLDSSGPDGRQRGSVSQLNEKYNSLAADAAASDDRILSESYLQFADHYHRLQKEIEIINEAREAKSSLEKNNSEINTVEHEPENSQNEIDKRPSRRKRGFQIREKEILNEKINNETNSLNQNERFEKHSSKTKPDSSKKYTGDIKSKEVKNDKSVNENDLLI
ncbi:DUF4167 domain-containing protein [Alphaproteobacteria bacterium]|nr:DUF4167 domain-containing protein [Alphaproteobacteria bacterium]